MANQNLPVQELDFDKIKGQLKTYLQSQSQFQDYDFDGSSLSILLDLLAYTTHYNGFYAHMLANESFVDSAYQKSSLTSKAKLMNYVPRSKQSSSATVTFTVDINAGTEPLDRKVLIPRGTAIKSNNNASDSRQFVLIDDVYIYNKATTPNTYNYTSDEVLVHEGGFDSERFLVDKTLTNQRFIIRDRNIDLKSLRVKVYPTVNDSEYVSYKRADDFMTVKHNTPVFFITMNEDEYYEIQFGNGVFGQDVYHQNKVEASFISTNGESGNNAKSFTFGAEFTYNGTDYPITVNALSKSEGGLEPETLEDLRFNIPYHFRRQNRTVTVDDYRNILLAEYRNINSINVWGGEDHEPRTYGKVFISIKPKFGDVLSSKAKSNIIEKIIRKHNIATVEVEIIDPNYLYVNLDVFVQFNPLRTDKSSGEIMSIAQAAITNYDTVDLNRFGGYYSNLELNTRIRSSNSAILTSYTEIKLEKRFTPALHTVETYSVDFINPLIAGTLTSDEFEFRLSRCYITDDGKGAINIWHYNVQAGKFEVYPSEVFGAIDYTTGVITLSDFEVNDMYGKPQIGLYAKPVKPDFFTKRNNIVQIDDVTVSVTENTENENEK